MQRVGASGMLCSLVLTLSGCRTIGLSTYRQSSEAMQPTLRAGQTFLASTTYYTFHPIADGDLIVYRKADSVVVKRVLALPGETIEGRQGALVRNGKPVQEPYLAPKRPGVVDPFDDFGPQTLVEGEVFVCGDNRAQSLDSRSPQYGTIAIKDVVGKLVMQPQ